MYRETMTGVVLFENLYFKMVQLLQIVVAFLSAFENGVRVIKHL